MKFYLEHTITLYQIDVIEADSIEEARELRDNATSEYLDHIQHELNRRPYKDELQNCVEYDNDLGVLDWDWDGPVMSAEEFRRKYTCLD